MPQLFRSSTRWAIYLRDGLTCVYCGVSLHELVRRRDGNFLSLDHINLRSGGGTNAAENLVTACFACNHRRGARSISAFARELGFPRSTLLNRINQRVRRGTAEYRLAAQIVLGQLEGFPAAQVVLDHDFLVRTRWQTRNLDVQHWKHLMDEEALFCPYCQRGRAFSAPQESHAGDDAGDVEDIPF